jgi:hypothetical protein
MQQFFKVFAETGVGGVEPEGHRNSPEMGRRGV